MYSPFSIRRLAEHFKNQDFTVESHIEECLKKAKASSGVFVSIDESIEQAAKEIDDTRRAGRAVSELSGIPITLKDLFGVKGQKTLAGSIVLKDLVEPENEDCDVVAPLRNAGLLFLGRTNMSEFAFSGMGLNPHYGNAKSIWDRETGRLPGGSSSGSAVSVAEGIVSATMGSDTAGSCRIPAAFNGIVGVKPSFGRLSLNGIFPLSPTSDAPGPLAVDLDSCFILDRILMGNDLAASGIPDAENIDIRELRLVIPQSIVLEDLDARVAEAFFRGVDSLRQAGATVIEMEMPSLDRCVDMFNQRAVVLYEAWHYHKKWLEKYDHLYDPFVQKRMKNGQYLSDAEQQARYEEKAQLKAEFTKQFREVEADGVIYPTVPCVPPGISETYDENHIAQVNLRCLRNTATANYFDGCSISLPCHLPNQAPVGLMVSSVHGEDGPLYRTAFAVESTINASRH